MNFLLVCTKTVCCRSRDYQEDHVHCTHCTAWVSKVRGTMSPSHPRLRRPCVCLFLLFIWLSASRSPKLHVPSLPKNVRVDDDATPLPPGAGVASVCPVDRARKLQRRLLRAGRQRQRQKPIDICCRRQSVVGSDAVIRDTVINTHLFVTDV